MKQKPGPRYERRRKGPAIVRYGAENEIVHDDGDSASLFQRGLSGRVWPRFVIAGILLIATQGALWGMARGFSPAAVAFNREAFLGLQKEFDGWESTDYKLDNRAFIAVGAEATINRVLQRQKVQVVSTHIAAFTNRDKLLPHLPAVCYDGAGHAILSEESVSIPGTRIRARLLTLDAGDEPIYALYWYQRGKSTYVDRDSGRAVVQKLWGKPVWPPLFKVLLQTSANNKEQAIEQMVSVAKEIANHLNQVLTSSDKA